MTSNIFSVSIPLENVVFSNFQPIILKSSRNQQQYQKNLRKIIKYAKKSFFWSNISCTRASANLIISEIY